jgi:hypothetical protein
VGQATLKNYKRSLRKTMRKEKDSIVSQFIQDNWDSVLVSSVRMIRRFKLKTRLYIALTILFKPERGKNGNA